MSCWEELGTDEAKGGAPYSVLGGQTAGWWKRTNCWFVLARLKRQRQTWV